MLDNIVKKAGFLGTFMPRVTRVAGHGTGRRSPAGGTGEQEARRPADSKPRNQPSGPKVSGTAKDLWRKADQARDAARWRTAVELYGQAIAAGGESAALYVQYGHALKETGTPAAAEAAYRRAIALQPELADSYLQLGHALKVQGKLHEAALSYLQAHVAGDASNHSMTELMALGWRKEIIEQVAHSRSSNAPSLSVELALAKLTMDVSALSEKVDSKLEQLEAILRDLNWIMSEQRAHATGAGEGGPGAGGGVGAIETELYAIRSHLWLLNSKLLTISERQLPA